MASVASAAIIEGSLIIGLDDGSIINCGFVQGPQGLKGDPGPMGATGDPGLDGNTIHTVAGTPRNDMGRDGDYAIDNVNWRIYGPKSGGVWGKAKEMLPGPENIIENGRNTGAATGGGGAGGGSGDGGPVFTNTVIATGAGRLAPGTGTTAIVNYPGSPLGMISPESGMGFKSNINAFFVKALEELEVNILSSSTKTAPKSASTRACSGSTPPRISSTSTTASMGSNPTRQPRGHRPSIYHISGFQSLKPACWTRVDIAGSAREIESVSELRLLKPVKPNKTSKLELLKPAKPSDGQIVNSKKKSNPSPPPWIAASGLFTKPCRAAGQYAIGVAVNSGYCIDQYERCIQAVRLPDNIDPVANQMHPFSSRL